MWRSAAMATDGLGQGETGRDELLWVQLGPITGPILVSRCGGFQNLHVVHWRCVAEAGELEAGNSR